MAYHDKNIVKNNAEETMKVKINNSKSNNNKRMNEGSRERAKTKKEQC
jgi:hypothetical protein